jgi:hypothetical protein
MLMGTEQKHSLHLFKQRLFAETLVFPQIMTQDKFERRMKFLLFVENSMEQAPTGSQKNSTKSCGIWYKNF